MESKKVKISNESASEKTKEFASELDQEQHVVSKFLKVIGKGIDKHGIKKIMSVLVNMDVHNEFQSKGTDVLVDFICSEVINSYNKNKEDKICQDDLFKKEKRGDITLARKMVMILLKQFVDITPTRLGDFLGRSRQVIHIAMDEFDKLDPKIKQDCDFLDKHDAISKKIVLFIEKNKVDTKK